MQGQSSPNVDPTLSASSTVTTPAASSAPPSTQASTAAAAARRPPWTRAVWSPRRKPRRWPTRRSARDARKGSPSARRCVYGSQTANVLTVFAAAAASADAAKAHWNQLLAEAQQGLSDAPAGSVKLTPESGLADRAEWVELDLSALQVSGRGLAFLSGNTGVYMIDLVRGARGTQPVGDDRSGAHRAGSACLVRTIGVLTLPGPTALPAASGRPAPAGWPPRPSASSRRPPDDRGATLEVYPAGQVASPNERRAPRHPLGGSDASGPCSLVIAAGRPHRYTGW